MGSGAARARASPIRTSPRRSIASARASARPSERWRRAPSVSCEPTRAAGFIDDIGSWKIIATRRAQMPRSPALRQRGERRPRRRSQPRSCATAQRMRHELAPATAPSASCRCRSRRRSRAPRRRAARSDTSRTSAPRPVCARQRATFSALDREHDVVADPRSPTLGSSRLRRERRRLAPPREPAAPPAVLGHEPQPRVQRPRERLAEVHERHPGDRDHGAPARSPPTASRRSTARRSSAACPSRTAAAARRRPRKSSPEMSMMLPAK